MDTHCLVHEIGQAPGTTGLEGMALEARQTGAERRAAALLGILRKQRQIASVLLLQRCKAEFPVQEWPSKPDTLTEWGKRNIVLLPGVTITAGARGGLGGSRPTIWSFTEAAAAGAAAAAGGGAPATKRPAADNGEQAAQKKEKKKKKKEKKKEKKSHPFSSFLGNTNMKSAFD